MALTEMVIMPGEDYQAICDSVRAKTGGTELLKSGEVAPAIDGIEINTGFQTYKAGTYSPSKDTSCGSGVYHGLGTKPNFYCIYCKESDALGSGYLNFAMGIQITGSGQAIYHYIDSQSQKAAATSTFFTSTTYFNLQSTGVNYKGGYTYNWIVGVI